jgi:dGTPase
LPHWGKSWDGHEDDLKTRVNEPEVNLIPMTLEGCLVKVCDTISYISRDIEDAISLGIIQREQVPQTLLGLSHREILRVFADDVIHCSYEKEYIAMSKPIYEAVHTLRKFNFEHIYFDPILKSESHKIRRGYRLLLEFLLSDYKEKGQGSHIWRDFLHSKEDSYLQSSSPQRQVVDYVAGMTDGFFLRTLQKIFVPSSIGISC